MEKISALIDKLQELKNSNAGLQSISYYVQLLQAEILHARNRQKQDEQSLRGDSSHIAVIMPSVALTESANGYPNNYNYTEKVAPRPIAQARPIAVQLPEVQEPVAAPPEQVPTPQPVTAQKPIEPPAPTPVAEQQPVAAPYEHKPVPEQHSAYAPKPAEPQPQYEPKPIAQRPAPVPPPPPAPIPEQPVEKRPAPAMITLFPQTPQPKAPKPEGGLHKELKELNQRVAQNTTSLNERFRQSQVELADRLGEMPVKDLRHAIGINDKFQFIQELFRGDVDTYERSIKTINEFHSMQEAEYWIERELKIRQGWEDDNRIVKQFYALVRKRFT